VIAEFHDAGLRDSTKMQRKTSPHGIALVAGILIGVSIDIFVFTATDEELGNWQALLILGSVLMLALGVALHMVVGKKASRPVAIRSLRPTVTRRASVPRNEDLLRRS